MMRFELGLEKRAPISAGTMAASYLVGDPILLSPNIMMSSISLHVSGLAAAALIYAFGCPPDSGRKSD
jgi:hypothetical protein